jgi:predicted TIM-barrel fold metal-dependent hydrolase
MTETLEILRRRNVVGVTSGPYLERWREAGGDRIIPALGFAFRPQAPAADEVRELLASGRYRVFAEVAIQYAGVSPDDPKFEPYLAAAEEFDVAVGIHIGTGPPGAPAIPGMGKYRARLHSALVLEEALVRHPELRVYVMHAGWPMLDDMLALMWAYPRVHVDTGALCFALPRKEFHRYFRRIVEAGFGKRIMFGSDQMNWPGAIESCIDAIDSADFLSRDQKRDVLYNNAARFLRLSEEEIARHHER